MGCVERLIEDLTKRCPIRSWEALAELEDQPPSKPGVYAWWFDSGPGVTPLQETMQRDERRLLYVGICPARAPKAGVRSRRTLRTRLLRDHLRGRLSVSTLRRTLAVLLEKELRLHIHLTPSGRLTLGGQGETLTRWMREHARVTWIVHERPWEVEPEIVRRLRVPLNITHNAHDAFTPALKSLRRDAKRRAAHLASQAG